MSRYNDTLFRYDYDTDTVTDDALMSRITAWVGDKDIVDLIECAIDVSRSEHLKFRHSYFCLSMREALEAVIDAKAPREDVKACRWYKQELLKFQNDGRKVEDKVTQRQKIIYGLQGATPDDFLQKRSNINLAARRSEIIKLYGKLSDWVHAKSTRCSDQSSVVQSVRKTLEAFHDFLDTYHHFRSEIATILKRESETTLHSIYFTPDRTVNRPQTTAVVFTYWGVEFDPLATTFECGGRFEYSHSANHEDPQAEYFKAIIPWDIQPEEGIIMKCRAAITLLDAQGRPLDRDRIEMTSTIRPLFVF
jgi:hypothetical protein|nr:hypothetical protein [Neorhizobium tomejilense]